MSDDKRWWRHQSTESLATDREWGGFVGHDNIEAITERVKRIVIPGRTFVLIHQDREWSTEVTPGLTLYTNKDSYQEPIRCNRSDSGGGMSVSLGPGIKGFGITYDREWVVEDLKAHPMTAREVRDFVKGDAKAHRRFDWSHVELHGGLGEPHQSDLITVQDCNQHGYRTMTQVIPADVPWQLRVERDAVALDQAIAVLDNTDDAHETWHPSHGLTADEVLVGRRVLEHMARKLRTWKEPLSRTEAFPAITDLR